MRKSKLSEAQIIGMLSEAAAGISPRDLCRRYQISLATYYELKNKYSGMMVSDLKRLKELEAENRILKTMYADIILGNKLVKELLEKKVSRANRRQSISGLQQRHAISVSHACKLMSVSKTMVYYKSKKKADNLEISLFLTSLAELHIRWGFDKMTQKVQLEKTMESQACLSSLL